jgi:hypothetical protein
MGSPSWGQSGEGAHFIWFGLWNPDSAALWALLMRLVSGFQILLLLGALWGFGFVQASSR